MNPTSLHPSCRRWALPPERPDPGTGLARTNLRALAARPGRFEHHLTVVARVGDTQLEIATATEPLCFAHRNLSDEFALPLPTGDAMVDAMPFLVFVTDPETGQDLGRVRHRAGDLVLHPDGYLHWPGRLRPPFEPPPPPRGGRRAVLSAVFCASSPTPAADRAGRVTPGREADVKAYAEPAPPLVLDELRGPPRVVARVGDARLSLATPPFSPARGGYVLVLEADSDHGAWPTDLVYVAPGAELPAPGVERALVYDSEAHHAAPPPAVWDRVPDAPFAPAEDAAEVAAAPAPIEVARDGDGARVVRVATGGEARVPAYWLARTLYRIALHTLVVDGLRVDAPRAGLGYVETYGGFFYDDHGGAHRFGVRGHAPVEVAPPDLAAVLERLYRDAAPEGYRERI